MQLWKGTGNQIKIETGYHLVTSDSETGFLHLDIEGPWETREQAEDFANAECGADWTVVYIKGGK